MTPSDPVQVLAATTLFSSLDPDDLASVAASCVSRTFGKGQFLCYQGDPGDRLFVVAQGLVKVTITTEHGDEMVFASLGPPEVLGELALLDGGPRSASVVAVVPTTVLMLNRPVLLRLMAAHPGVLNAVLAALGRMVRRLGEQASDLVFLDLGARLSKLLVRLADERGSAVLDHGLTQSDLANMIGASRPAVNRVLQTLASRGLVEVNGQEIVVRDLAALRHRAGL